MLLRLGAEDFHPAIGQNIEKDMEIQAVSAVTGEPVRNQQGTRFTFGELVAAMQKGLKDRTLSREELPVYTTYLSALHVIEAQKFGISSPKPQEGQVSMNTQNREEIEQMTKVIIAMAYAEARQLPDSDKPKQTPYGTILSSHI